MILPDNWPSFRISATSSGQSSEKCHENSFIVSHTLYGIWDKVYERNDDAFGRILFRSLRYVPSNPRFSEFRDAFLFTMSKSHPTDDVAYASTFFDVAGIKSAGSANIARMKAIPPEETLSKDGQKIQVGGLIMTIPSSWESTYVYKEFQEGIVFYEKYDYESFEGLGTIGHLVTIRLDPDDKEPEWFPGSDDYEMLGTLTTPKGRKYSVKAFYPTEPQVGPEDWGGRFDVYNAMSLDIPMLLESICGVNGNVFTPAT